MNNHSCTVKPEKQSTLPATLTEQQIKDSDYGVMPEYRSYPKIEATPKRKALTALAKRANQAHEVCQSSIQSALNHAKRCGDTLLAAKTLTPFGTFENWVTKNCKFSPRMARRYMTIANGWDKILDLSKRTRVSDLPLDSLSIREALRILSAGGPEELNPVYLDRTCPSCGERLVVTSARWATCPSCWNCKLYPHSSEQVRMNLRGGNGALRTLEQIEPIRRAEIIATILANMDADTVKWLEHSLTTGKRTIDQAAAERIVSLAKQCQAAQPVTVETMPPDAKNRQKPPICQQANNFAESDGFSK